MEHIFEAAVAGEGDRVIASNLNRKNIPAFRGQNGWHSSSISMILRNEAVMGIYQPHQRQKNKRYPVGEPKPGYYPKIITEELYWRAQAARKQRRVGGGGRKDTGYPNLFRGITRCARCNASLRFVNKSKGKHAGRGPYLTCCNNRRAKCLNTVHYPYQVLEDQVLSYVLPVLKMNLVMSTPRHGEDPVVGLEAELEAKNTRLDELYQMSDLRGARPRIEALSKEIDELEARLVEARKNAKMVEADSRNGMGQLFQLVAGLSLFSGEELRALRIRLGQELRRVVEVIRLNWNREVAIELKPAGGCRVIIKVNHHKITGRAALLGATLTEIETGEVAEIPSELFRAATYEFLDACHNGIAY